LIAAFETDVEANAESGDRYFFEGGSYTSSNTIDSNARDAASTNLIEFIGVVSGTTAEPPTSSDWATGSNRPSIAFGANNWVTGNSYNIKNFILTGEGASVLSCGQQNQIFNVKATNSSEVADRDAFSGSEAYAFFIDCEGISTNGQAILAGAYGSIYGCYAHDSKDGLCINAGSLGNKIVFSIADTCTNYGILSSGYSSLVSNNTVYNCGTGIRNDANRHTNRYVCNLLSTCTNGAVQQTAEQESHFFDWNFYHSCTTPTTNVTEGPNSDESASDPEFTDAANGDFSIGTNLKGLGFPGAFPGGLTTGYLEPGAVQREEAGATVENYELDSTDYQLQ